VILERYPSNVNQDVPKAVSRSLRLQALVAKLLIHLTKSNDLWAARGKMVCLLVLSVGALEPTGLARAPQQKWTDSMFKF
jgi:hypothetical protein